MASPIERLRLLEKMDKSGRLKWVPSTEARRTHLSGLFCVAKDQDRDRLILDARSPNLLEEGLTRWTQSMASAATLGHMSLREHEELLVSSTDLKDFYYHFLISKQRVIRNCLAVEYPACTARLYSGFDHAATRGQRFRPALASMAMGDLNSVEFGQAAHLSLALGAGAIYPSELLTLRTKPPRGDIAGGIIIDDLVVFEKVSREAAALAGKGLSVGASRLRKAAAAYESEHLIQSQAKTSVEARKTQVWGADIDGQEGVIRPPVERLLPVISLTIEIAKSRVVTKYLLSVLSGFYVAVFQFRRRFMSLLEEVFKAPTWAGDHVALEVWPALENELWTLALLSPLVHANLRASFCEEFSATDASDAWEAEVTTQLGPYLPEELARHTLQKSVWTRLLRPLDELRRVHGDLAPSEELPGEEELQGNPLWRTVLCSLQFEECWRERIRRKRHINVHELRAILRSEARRGRLSPSSRVLTAADSQVALGAVLKGRSASARLNGILRQSLPTHVALDLYGYYLYSPSSENPADDPTRNAVLRAPAEATPDWLVSALKGDFSGLDQFLEKIKLDRVSLMGLPPLCHIVPKLSLPLTA